MFFIYFMLYMEVLDAKIMKKQIKLMLDYQCWPLWFAGDGEEIGNIDPRTLPLNIETIKDLEVWSEVFDSQLNLQYPKNIFSGKELSNEEWDNLEKEGIRLWKKLIEEFGYKL